VSETAGEASWIAADWGTSTLRAWAMDGAGGVAGHAEGPGMDGLEPAEFEAALLELVAPWLRGRGATEVLICGMAGARSGWREAGYLDLPAMLDGLSGRLTAVETADSRLCVSIVPGLAQRAPDAPDVMRGEETQLLGLARLLPGFAGLVCLPGTHSKWVLLEDGRVTRFRSYMTGELFGLLTRRSILRRSFTDSEHHPAGFAAGARRGLEAPEQILASLFTPRAAGLLQGWTPDHARAWLSGVMIGAEVAAALAAFGAERGPPALIAAAALAERYREVIEARGLEVRLVAGEDAVLAGLAAIREAAAGRR